MPFYKKQDGQLVSSMFVDAPGYMLSEAGKDEYTYPIDGWYWFDSLDQAMASLSTLQEGRVSALAGLSAIHEFGFADAYTVWATSPDRTFIEKAFIDKAVNWDRSSPVLVSAANALGLTDDQLDALFARAVEIDRTI